MPIIIVENTPPFKSLPNIAPDFGNDWMSNAHEIQLPPAISWVPEPSIIIAIISLVLLITSCIFWAWYRSRQSTLYCRQAHANLDVIEQRLHAGDLHALADIPGLLKQVALSRWPRTALIELDHQGWFEFWRASASVAPPSFIHALAYQSREDIEALSCDQRLQLVHWSRNWIEEHQLYVGYSVAQLTRQSEASPEGA